MEYRRLHGWEVTPQEAVRIQQDLRARLIARDDDPAEFRTIAAMDVSYDKRSPWLFAGIVVMRLPEPARRAHALVNRLRESGAEPAGMADLFG